MSATPTAAAFSYLFIEHESRRERGQHDEKYVEVDEQADRLLVVARQSHRGLHRHAASDNERDPQRKGEQRQEQLPRTNARHDRREEASQGSHADGREQHRREGAAESDESGEHQREPEDAWRDRRSTARVDLKAEIADEERENDELRKRRHELACAP